MRWFITASLLFTVAAHAGETLKPSERMLLEESISAAQAAIEAQSGAGYSMELRPRISEAEVGVALRVYMPEVWNKNVLRERLALAAESEQLRVAALEWQELIQTFRLFCVYREQHATLQLLDQERVRLEPWLKKADEAVDLNQLAVADRTRLYSLYLDLLNRHEKIKSNQLDTAQALRMWLGAEADLPRMAKVARVDLPPLSEFNVLLNQALEHRPDFQQFGLQSRSLSAAVTSAEWVEGFRLKYIQPAYEIDHGTGEGILGLSASFILPWGTRRSDADLYRKQRALVAGEQERQRLLIGHRLRVLLKSAKAHYATSGERNERINPILRRIEQDVEIMDTGRLEELRDLLAVRERLLDVALESAAETRRTEELAVELAAELGTLTP